jgi:hypothetical protein
MQKTLFCLYSNLSTGKTTLDRQTVASYRHCQISAKINRQLDWIIITRDRETNKAKNFKICHKPFGPLP